MPIYEFKCSTCNNDFEELVFSSNSLEDVTCPECGSSQVAKKISTFASKVSGGSSFSVERNAASSCSPGGL